MSYIRQKYEGNLTPIRRSANNSITAQKQQHYTDSDQIQNRNTTATISQKKTQYSPVPGRPDSSLRFQEVRESMGDINRMKQSNKPNELNDIELRRLMNLVEMQQQEIDSWKRKYEQLEDQIIRFQSNQDVLKEYEQHVEQLSSELQYKIQQNEELQYKLREKDSLLQRVQKSEEHSNFNLKKTHEELQFIKSQLLQQEKDKLQQVFSKDLMIKQQMESLQQLHINQTQVQNDQIEQIQSELMKRSEEVDILSDENVNIHNAFQDTQKTLRNALIAIEGLKTQLQDAFEEKRRDTYSLQQQRDQQVFALKKESSEERNSLMSKIGQLEYTIEKLKDENLILSNASDEFKKQVDNVGYQVKQQQDNLRLLKNESDQAIDALLASHKKQVNQLKHHYQEQLEELMSEVQKLTEILREKSKDAEKLQLNIGQLNDYLKAAEKEENQLLQELEHQKQKYQSLEQHSKNELDKLLQENYQDIEQLEAQISRLEKVLQLKSQECDDTRHLKNEVSIKMNEANLVNQKLLVELECLRSKFLEAQRQNDVQEEVREEIKRSQMEQLRRTLESTADQLEYENRNIKYLLDNKTRECEEWRQNYMKVRPQAF